MAATDETLIFFNNELWSFFNKHYTKTDKVDTFLTAKKFFTEYKKSPEYKKIPYDYLGACSYDSFKYFLGYGDAFKGIYYHTIAYKVNDRKKRKDNVIVGYENKQI